MRIAFISTMAAAPWGGSEELWTRTALEAIGQGNEVFCSVAGWENLAPEIVRLREKGATLHLRPLYSPDLLTRIRRRIQNKLGFVKSLEKSLDKFLPSVVCVNQGGNFDLTEMHWLREYLLRCKVPLCILCHNFNPGLLPLSEQRQHGVAIFEKAARVFFVSQEQAHVTQRQLAHKLINYEVVKNPVNLATVASQPWPQNPVAQLAMVAGLHVNRKGHDIALEVLSQKQWHGRSWHLNLYGDGPDRVYLEELVALFGLGERVTMHGNVNDIELVWQKNHLLLLPSRLEAAPLVVIEAMLCGRPVVATAVGTIPEWIVPNVQGFIAPAATVPLFANALEVAWAARDQWPEMGRQAHNDAHRYSDPHAPSTFLRQLIKLAS